MHSKYGTSMLTILFMPKNAQYFMNPFIFLETPEKKSLECIFNIIFLQMVYIPSCKTTLRSLQPFPLEVYSFGKLSKQLLARRNSFPNSAFHLRGPITRVCISSHISYTRAPSQIQNRRKVLIRKTFAKQMPKSPSWL